MVETLPGGHIDIRRAPVPNGSTSVLLIVNAYLGPNETSSLYVDDLSLSRVR